MSCGKKSWEKLHDKYSVFNTIYMKNMNTKKNKTKPTHNVIIAERRKKKRLSL